jgi:UDP-glucuronate decarboxylase
MTDWSTKSVLVAGGAGFLGRHLVWNLLQRGAKVHVIDDLSTGAANDLGTVKLIHHDIAIPADLPACDVIFNLASPASPPIYQRDPIQTWKSNVLGTLHMLEHAMRCDATLVQASTSEIYGDPLSHPQKEEHWGHVNPIGPRACYDESKRAAETLLMDAYRTRGTDVRIARIFNTYGPGMTAGDGRLIPNFIAQASKGQALTIYGDGRQTRSLCYIDDTVDGLRRLAEVDAAKGEAINIGNPHEQTILEIAASVKAVIGAEVPFVFSKLPTDDPVRRCPDISKAKRLLGWTPETDLAEGLKAMLLAVNVTA